MLFCVKEDYQYIDLLFLLGKGELAIREMNLLADAVKFAQIYESCMNYGRFFKGIEADLREHIGLDGSRGGSIISPGQKQRLCHHVRIPGHMTHIMK